MGELTNLSARELLRVEIKRRFKTQKACAEHFNTSGSFISAVLGGKKEIPPYLCDLIGYEKVIRSEIAYRPIRK